MVKTLIDKFDSALYKAIEKIYVTTLSYINNCK